MSRQAYRAALLHMLDDPSRAGTQTHDYHPDGLLLVEDGHVAAFGDYAQLRPHIPEGTPVEELPGRLITPGFVDAHVHYPQADVIAAWGAQLMDWLHTHTFPAEMAFADRAHADAVAQPFSTSSWPTGPPAHWPSAPSTRPRPRRCSRPRWTATCASSPARC